MAAKDPDRIRINHMMDAIQEALSFIEGLELKNLEKDRMRALSLIKEIEIVGEAANKVSPEFKEKHPKIRWKSIIGTRHRLTHGYFDIDLAVVWATITEDFPTLLKALEDI